MAFKLNISEKNGKTWKLETENEVFLEKALNDKIEGRDISGDLSGYEFEITGASDKAGFPSFKEVEGIGLGKLLLDYGKGMHRKPRGLKKVGSKPEGLRLRKTVRGRIISPDIIQINLKVLKEGSKKLHDIFPEQNQPKAKAEIKTEPVAQ
jgi:small subunit ribosomal protein S6e